MSDTNGPAMASPEFSSSFPDLFPSASRRQVLFVGGPTGGHLYPALALAEELERLTGCEPVFLSGTRPIERSILGESRFRSLVIPGLECSSIKDFLTVRRGLNRTVNVDHVAAVVATGGRASIAPVRWARHRHRPVFLLEQNRVVGRAHRWLSRSATRMFLSFDDTQGPRGIDRKSLRLGCPVRRSFAPRPLPEGPRTLLVLGGSQGSQAVNQVVRASLTDPSLREAWAGWQVIHLTGHGKSSGVGGTGESDDRSISEVYAEAEVVAEVSEYAADPAELLARCHLVFARAGGSTVAEVAAMGRAALYLPYPHHRDRQQFLNAESVADRGGAEVIEESPRALAEALTRWGSGDRALANGAERAAERGRPDAASRIAEVIATHMERLPANVADLSGAVRKPTVLGERNEKSA